jgi:hypothetical protein
MATDKCRHDMKRRKTTGDIIVFPSSSIMIHQMPGLNT